jgi:hypothetical protein
LPKTRAAAPRLVAWRHAHPVRPGHWRPLRRDVPPPGSPHRGGAGKRGDRARGRRPGDAGLRPRGRDRAGPSVVYQTPKFHIDGILAYGDVEDFTTLAIGGRFYYELHSTQASDLSIGGGLGLINISVGDESDTSFQFEAGGKIRAFLAPSVAINAALGLGYITGDNFDYVLFGGQLMGSVGLTYFFF